MRLRIGGLIELILAVAGVLAIARAVAGADDSPADPTIVGLHRVLHVSRSYVVPMMQSLGLIGGLGLWFERVRRRSPTVWGMGRWTWSLSAVILILSKVLDLIPMVLTNSLGYNSLIFTWWPGWGLHRQVYAIIASWITARLAGLPRDPTPDAREWAGRLYALLILLFWGLDQTASLILLEAFSSEIRPFLK